jgi:hypothetical protein
VEVKAILITVVLAAIQKRINFYSFYLTYNEIKLNITKAINEIPKEIYINLLIGSYKRDNAYINIKKSSRKVRLKD